MFSDKDGSLWTYQEAIVEGLLGWILLVTK